MPHRIFYYEPQKAAVLAFLSDLGACNGPNDSPHPVRAADQLRGLEHITFVTIDGHPRPIPQRMWDVIVGQGAMVIHVDDQYTRSDHTGRVNVHHYQGASREGSVEGGR